MPDPVEMHGPVIQTKQSAVLKRSNVLEAIWHSEGFAVRFQSKGEVPEKEVPGLPPQSTGRESQISSKPDLRVRCLSNSSRGN